MDPSDYELIPLGNYLGKIGFAIFGIVFALLFIGLIVGSTYTQDMYVYSDMAYHHCVQRMKEINGSPIPINEGH